jgi:hypothetical protein
MNAIKWPYRALRRRMGRAAAIAVLLLGVTAASALAYYTLVYNGASGSGSSQIASSGGTNGTATAVTFGVSFTGSALAPGESTPLTVTATDNDPSNSPIVTNSSIVPTVTTSVGGCLPRWFTVSGLPSAGGTAVAIGANNAAFATGTIAMTNTASSQTACEGATVTVSLAANVTDG